jgi:hypothetical protein
MQKKEMIEKTVDMLNRRGFSCRFFSEREQLRNYLKTEIANEAVAIGGSVTVKELELYPMLKETNCVIWQWEDGYAALPLAKHASVYIASANAISMAGEIVNIDGIGNRVAATLYGADRVYLIAGVNKIEKDLVSAIARAKNIAAPLNAKRLSVKTPCAVKGDKCYDCDSPERICAATVILEKRPSGIRRFEVLIVDEALGF